MAKTLTISFGNKEYTLEFTRRSVATMERRGFNPSDIEDKPITTLPTLFAGAFLAHHATVKQEVIDDIFSHLTNKSEFIGKLAEMYNEPIKALLDEPAEDDAGNVSWTANW